jgi:antitoxin CptB
LTARDGTRLRWRCRRGLKELDVLLERYLCRRWPTAAAAERAQFAALVELGDPELAALCLRGVPASDPALAALLREITTAGQGDARP